MNRKTLARYIAEFQASPPEPAKKRAKSSRPEDKLHMEITRYLRAVIGKEGKCNPGRVYWQSLEARAKRSAREGAANKSRGVVAGFAELIVISNGHFFLAEIKTPEGRLTDSQKQTHPELHDAGATVAVLRSIDSVRVWLSMCGVPTREAV